MSQNIPIENQPFRFIYGLGLANDATTPDEIVTVATGSCRDSNDVMDIVVSSALSMNATVNGVNGLDTGALANNTMYAMYVIADSSGKKVVASLLSLASNAVPLMPFEYDSYRKVGYVVTDGTADFVAFYQYGNGNQRTVNYSSAPVLLTSGSATAYTAIDLSAAVPPEENILVWVNAELTPNGPGDQLDFTPGNDTGVAARLIGQVAAQALTGRIQVMARVTAGVPEIDYKVSIASASADASIPGYTFSV